LAPALCETLSDLVTRIEEDKRILALFFEAQQQSAA
jgi:hypothetical protein